MDSLPTSFQPPEIHERRLVAMVLLLMLIFVIVLGENGEPDVLAGCVGTDHVLHGYSSTGARRRRIA